MIQAVIFVPKAPEDALQRLARGGVRALEVSDATAAISAAQAWGLHPGAILVVGAEVHGMASWHQVTAALRRSDAHETRPAATLLMQAIVQHNRAAALSAAAPLTTAQQHSNKQQCALGQAQAPEQPPLLVVGYVMRPSRETALAAQGLLHLLPVRGLCYMPWEPDLDPEDQGHVDILLHKASDELVQGPPGGPPTWSPRMDRMLAWLATVPHVAVVDPLHAAAKAVDRVLLARLLEPLEQEPLPCGTRARSPRCIVVQDWDAAALAVALEDAGLALPLIAKPGAACGLAHSHAMALMLGSPHSCVAQLTKHVALPALLQEFVNHGGLQWKAYVMGQRVFVTPRESIPDVRVVSEDQPDTHGDQSGDLLLFDSLSTLPTQLPPHLAAAVAPPHLQQAPPLAAIDAIAAFLRRQLGLSLFGFDVVSPTPPPVRCTATEQQRELIVIDVNYFPNYRGVADAPSAMHDVLLDAWRRRAAVPVIAPT